MKSLRSKIVSALVLSLAFFSIAAPTMADTYGNAIGKISYLSAQGTSSTTYYMLVGVTTSTGQVFAYRYGNPGPMEMTVASAAAAQATVNMSYDITTGNYQGFLETH